LPLPARRFDVPHLDYLPEEMGSATITPDGPVEAGSYAFLVYTYTAGKFGIDDTGGIKICFRGTSDIGKPQFGKPGDANYVSVEASNGVRLSVLFDQRLNIRPWTQTVFIRTTSGFLRAGDRITVRFGDRSGGSPGMRMQTNIEDTFEFRTYVDALATYEFVQLPASPEIALVAGPATTWRLILPTERAVGDAFHLAIVPADRWGNPASFGDRALRLAPCDAIAGLSDRLEVAGRTEPLVLDGLSARRQGDLVLTLLDDSGAVIGISNPLRIGPAKPLRPFWADMHGQSEETIGTNSAEAYFHFARERSFLDVVGHQGNDFQITPAFWRELNALTARFNAPGSFVTLPGYEWSGNTGMGGDRNVFYVHEGEPIFRSSRVLVDLPDDERDCHTVGELFETLSGRDAVMVAHVGGRYADLHAGHDGRLERAVEIHSSWGTFEWLLHDAFALGFRAGIVCNSDDHKGRQGATSPGASQFGAIGGLTCVLLPRLDRAAVFEALRRRRHYGTTGCRMFLHVEARMGEPAELFDDDPALGAARSVAGATAEMGHIVRTEAATVEFIVEAIGSTPIERIDVFNGTELLATFRSFSEAELGRRIRVIWEGAEYRGRGRQTVWDGSLKLAGNSFSKASAVNFLNADTPLRVTGTTGLAWNSVTTGNMAGLDILLDDAAGGTLRIDPKPASAVIPIGEIGMADRVVDAGGLGRRIRVLRLPERLSPAAMDVSLTVALHPGRDNPVYARVTQEDGHQAWSSPIYFIP
jgi:hypothetical protein